MTNKDDFNARAEGFRDAVERLKQEYNVQIVGVPVIVPVQLGAQVINSIDARLQVLDAMPPEDPTPTGSVLGSE